MNGYYIFEVKTTWRDLPKKDYVVHRRYNHFLWLREKILSQYGNHVVPILPEKNIMTKVYNNDHESIKERIRCLRHFIAIMASHSALMFAEDLKYFLTEDDKVTHCYSNYLVIYPLLQK